MYRIMVADDEPKTRKGLCGFLAECGLPLTVCAQASNGEEALQLLLEQRPDIVLLDICMPHMDGLEFLAKAKRLGIHAKFIVLTGFDEFSFAKQSVALRAFAYLLKPVDEVELTTHLQQAVQELDAERRRTHQQQQVATQVDANRNLLRHSFLTSWIDGLLDEAGWNENAAFWSIQWPVQAWMTVVKAEYELTDILHKQEKALMLFGACNIAEELLEPCGLCCSLCHEKGYAVLITEACPCDTLLESVTEVIHQHLRLPCQAVSQAVEHPLAAPGCAAALLSVIDEKTQYKPLVEDVRRCVEAQYKNPDFSLTDLSRTLAISKPHLSRLIRSAFSTTYTEYLTSVRMRNAIRLMGDPQNKLSWIALEVGYSNLHYFSYAFKKHTGLSPSAYREKTYGMS